MSDNSDKKAVIYCRVASTVQNRPGSAITSQETRCRDYAAKQGYTAVKIFEDLAVSGNSIDRPGLNAMLAFLKEHQGDPHIVLVDDVTRLARDLTIFVKLRQAIRDAGGMLECPTMKFGDDAQDQLLESEIDDGGR